MKLPLKSMVPFRQRKIKSKGTKAMKINKEYFESKMWEYGRMKGQKMFEFMQIGKNIGAYADGVYCEVIFELDTLERIGLITESDVRCSRNRYYTASYEYGWDGNKKTKKTFWKTLCTRGDYETARALILQEYKARCSA